MRLIIAGIVGGVVMFMWGAVSHVILPFERAGIKTIPNEEAVVSAMKTNITEPGFYFIPGMNMNNQTAEEEKAWTEKYKTGPTGILIYHPTGQDPMSAKQLLIELGSNICAVLIGAFLISWIAPSFSKQVVAATLIGLTAWLSINISYWNWYRFPTSFVLLEGIDQIVSWFLAGLAVALVLHRRKPLA
jgi:hypothetical protein